MSVTVVNNTQSELQLVVDDGIAKISGLVFSDTDIQTQSLPVNAQLTFQCKSVSGTFGSIAIKQLELNGELVLYLNSFFTSYASIVCNGKLVSNGRITVNTPFTIQSGKKVSVVSGSLLINSANAIDGDISVTKNGDVSVFGTVSSNSVIECDSNSFVYVYPSGQLDGKIKTSSYLNNPSIININGLVSNSSFSIANGSRVIVGSDCKVTDSDISCNKLSHFRLMGKAELNGIVNCSNSNVIVYQKLIGNVFGTNAKVKLINVNGGITVKCENGEFYGENVVGNADGLTIKGSNVYAGNLLLDCSVEFNGKVYISLDSVLKLVGKTLDGFVVRFTGELKMINKSKLTLPFIATENKVNMIQIAGINMDGSKLIIEESLEANTKSMIHMVDSSIKAKRLKINESAVLYQSNGSVICANGLEIAGKNMLTANEQRTIIRSEQDFVLKDTYTYPTDQLSITGNYPQSIIVVDPIMKTVKV